MTDLIEVKTADLAGEALHWAVAIAENLEPFVQPPEYGNPHRVFLPKKYYIGERYTPSTDWSQGGPLIEKYNVQLSFNGHRSGGFCAYVCNDNGVEYRPSGGGRTHLVAACRAVVASKFPNVVKVPKELMP